jgi:hypothetical protein
LFWHDESLLRIQAVDTKLSELTADQARRHGVPTLANVFEALDGQAFVDVELKEWVPAVMDVLEAARGPRLERAAVSAFDTGVLRQVAVCGPPGSAG